MRSRTKFGQFIRNNKSLLLFAVLMLVFRGAIADWHPVPTGSMKPTILEGDVIFQNKLAYDLKIPYTKITLAKLGQPTRGDIIVMDSEAADLKLIKRLIGLPGDEIRLSNNELFINGLPAIYVVPAADNITPIRPSDREGVIYAMESFDDMQEHAVSIRPKVGLAQEDFHYIVPEGEYFFMGDNRDRSADSRYYGSIPREQLSGKATHTLVSLNILDSYKPRLERFFARLN